MDPQRQNDQGVPMAKPPQSVTPAQAAAVMPLPASEPPLPVQMTAQPPVPAAPQPQAAPALSTQVTGTPAMAADNDVIEPEWILKTKQIIAETRDNPYKQVQRINQLKADYMQKRYNKTVKLPDA
jgi:hypothetical protein